MEEKWVLLIETDDKKGLIYQISGVLVDEGINVAKNSEFVDKEKNRFFMRSELEGSLDKERIKERLLEIIPNAHIELKPSKKKDIVVLVTKEAHAIGDMLIKHQFNSLNANIKAVVGNYDILESLVSKFDIPYHCVSHEGLTREEHEKKILEVVDSYSPEYVVLAKYMRILTPEFVKNYENKIVNIHHSFLPAFIGANPYKQAFQRGVKIIGATSHFVNNDLDEGPIIYQNVIPVDHSYTWQEMASAGRDVETNVLANALKLVFDDRVFVTGNKTVIL